MRAWLPEREVHGPERATERDIEGLNRVFADAFTDRYRRDGLVGVRVPHLNPLVWRYALLDAGDGAMVWRDESGHVAAFNIAHRSGTEGWMGPLAVRPDRQAAGAGKTVVQTALDWLIAQGVATLGLETMPRTVDNVGFYSRLGFAPGHLTVTMTHDLSGRGHPAPALLSSQRGAARDERLAAAGRLVDALGGGYDFTREIQLTAELSLGDTVLVEGGRGGGGGMGSTPSCCGTRRRSPRDGRAMRCECSSSRRATRAPSTRRWARRKPPPPGPASAASRYAARPRTTTPTASSSPAEIGRAHV